MTQEVSAERAGGDETGPSVRHLKAAIGAALSSARGSREALQAATEQIVQHLDAAFARVWTIDDTGSVLELQASAGLYTHIDGGHARVRVGAFKIGRIAEEKLPHLTNDIAHDERVGDRAWARRLGLTSFAGYPLLSEGRLLGVVAMFGRSPLPKSTLDSLAAVADLIAEGLSRRALEAVFSVSAASGGIAPSDGAIPAPANEARFRFLADAIPHQVWTARPDGALDYVNQRVVDYFERTPDQLIGEGWLATLHPDDVDACIQRWTHSLSSGEPYEFEFRLWSKRERRYRWHVAVALPRRDASGRITQWFGTNTDIDGRRRIEDVQRTLLDAGRRLSTSLDHAATLAELGAICVPAVADWCLIDLLEPDGSVTRAHITYRDPSQAGVSLALRRAHEGVRALAPSAVVLRDARAVFLGDVTSADVSTLASGPAQSDALREMGICSYIAAPLVAHDRVIGALTLLTTSGSGRRLEGYDLAVAEDLGRRAAFALENARYYREVQAANQELDQFAYVASHDLKAPLRGIANLSQWLEEGMGDKLDAEGREHMQLLRGRVHRLEALIDGILSYARAGRVRAKLEPVAVGPLVSEVVELLAPPPATRIEIQPVLPTIHAERVALQQVFLNLLGNALKHAARDGAHIQVTCVDAGEAWDFAVADDGPGIAPEFHARIWNIFQTLAARDKVEGTGIGLSVVKKLVESRGGRVSVVSRPGEGATFHVLWPKHPGEAPSA